MTAYQGGQKNRNGKWLWFFFTMFSTSAMIGENQQLITSEPVEFEK